MALVSKSNFTLSLFFFTIFVFFSNQFVYMEAWEVQLAIRIGGGGQIGADGLAFWYSQDPRKEGAAFGSIERWNGLGIFFDTFDNDGLVSEYAHFLKIYLKDDIYFFFREITQWCGYL